MDRMKGQTGSILVESAACGIMFIGFVMGIIVTGIWIYNSSQVSQAARIAAHNAGVTGNAAESQNIALNYLNKSLIAHERASALLKSAGLAATDIEVDFLVPWLKLFPDDMVKYGDTGELAVERNI